MKPMSDSIKKKKLIYFGLGFLLSFNVLAWAEVYDLSKPARLEVNFFDVGQGDAIFITTPSKQQILIDGGPSSAILEKISKAMPFYDRSIDLVVFTHPDPDHLLGLIDVLRSYKIGAVGNTGIKSSKSGFISWQTEVSENKIQEFYLTKGNVIKFSDDSYIKILAPFEDFKGKEAADANSSSLVMKLVFGRKSFLITGDSPKSVEEEMLEKEKEILDSDVLKVGHHGSKTSTSEAFLVAVSPEVAVIQVGKDNRYGHPNQEVLETLERYGIRILRTDQLGDIKITTDGNSLNINKN